jgi:hypothetical protein
VGPSAIAMGGSAGDFGLQQGDPRGQFVKRKTVERFGCQLAGQIPLWAWAIVDIHCNAQCGAFDLAVNLSHG